MIYLPNPRSAYDGPIYGFFDDPYTLAAKGYNGAERNAQR